MYNSTISRNRYLLQLTLLSVLITAVQLDAAAPGRQLERFLDREILTELPAGSRLQLLVRDAQSGEVLFSHQGEDNCVPASTVKLLTAGLACEILGPDFRFSTHLFADIESINNDTLCGDIHLIADGDPSLTSDDLTLLTASLARQLRGVEGGPLQLDGSLVMETAIFDTLNRGPGWMWDDGDYSWSADVTSLIVNLNCIGLECRESVHGKRLYWLPALELYPVEWRDGSALRRRVGNRFEIGHHVFREEPRTIVRNLEQPEAAHGRAVLQLLREQGITVNGKLIAENDRFSSQSDSGFVHHSAPLADLLQAMLRRSNNLYAEALFKRCDAAVSGEPGSWSGASRLLQSWMVDSLGLADIGQIVDGSGMSRYNLISPELLTQMLFLYQREPWFEEFRTALPVMGQQGTVIDRELYLPGTIARVKTGSLRNHKLISGYLEQDGETRWIFFINIDGYTERHRDVILLQDRIISYIAGFK